MRIVLQRVKHATVSVDGSVTGKIEKGYLLFLGIGPSDTKEIAEKMLDKILKLRLFEDENGKMNLNISQVGGRILTVSQFTLYADCRKGTRPGFSEAAEPNFANEMYEYFLSLCKEKTGCAEHGSFGADMQVELLNDGPVTIFLDSDNK